MSDLHGVAKHWQEYTKPIFKVNPIQLSEMYAYMAGAANLGLKQVRLEHYMVSAPGEGVGGEGSEGGDTRPRALSSAPSTDWEFPAYGGSRAGVSRTP